MPLDVIAWQRIYKFFSSLVVFSLFITAIPFDLAHAGEFSVYDHRVFVRSTGKPVVEQGGFSVINPSLPYRLRIYNGGVNGEYERVSSAVVSINGRSILEPRELNQKVGYIEKEVSLQDANAISVELRGKPNGALVINVLGEDDVAPTITALVTPTVNDHGWHNADVSVSFECSDHESGIAECTPERSVSTEGTGQNISGIAVDNAGNRSETSASLNIDKSAPILNLAQPQNGVVVRVPPLAVSGVVVDALSTPSVSVNGEAVSIAADGHFEQTITLAEGESRIVIAAMDAAGNRVELVRQVTLILNEPPVANSQVLSTAEDVPLPLQLDASDADGDPLSFTLTAMPAHGTLSGTAPNLVYTPNANFFGADQFSYFVDDGIDPSNPASVSINITPVNDAPEIQPQPLSLQEDASLLVPLVSSDVEGDALSFRLDQTPANGTVTIIGAELSYTPNTDYFGADQFSVIANDGQLDSVAAVFPVTVSPVNDAPTLVPAQFTLNEDGVLDITPQGSDIDNDPLSYIIVTPPTNGLLTGTAPVLRYTPNADFNGSDNFSVKVSDGALESAAAAMGINVTAVNDAPVAEAQTLVMAEDASVAVTLSGTDVDGDALSYRVVTAPANGSISGTAPNLSYSPNPDFFGFDSLRFVVSDGALESEAVVKLTVTPVNDAPVAHSQSVSVDMNGAVSATLTGDDVENTPLVYVITQLPLHGTIRKSLPEFIYTPEPDYTGDDSFVFTVNDGQLSSLGATFNIAVNPVAAPLSINSQPVTYGLVNTEYRYQLEITGGISTTIYSLPSAPPGMSIDQNSGLISWTPEKSGRYAARVQVSNGDEVLFQDLTIRVVDPQASHEGDEFWMMFPTNYVGHIDGEQLLISSTHEVTGVVEVPSQNFSLPIKVFPGAVTAIDIAKELINSTGIRLDHTHAVHIATQDPVAVQAINWTGNTTDGFLVLPVEALGSDHVAVGYDDGQIDVLAIEDNTQITLSFPPGSEKIMYGTVVPAIDEHYTLNRGEVQHFDSYHTNRDSTISGISVNADKPIAVFSGHKCANVPHGYGACDHLVEQVPPSDQLGLDYASMPLSTRSNGDTFRIVSNLDDTQVSVNGNLEVFLNKGEWWEGVIDKPTLFESNHPVLIAQFSNGHSYDNVPDSDPFMLLLTPEEQFLKRYTFSIPPDGMAHNFINVVSPLEGVGTLTLDGIAVGQSLFSQISGSNLWGAQIPVAPGSHTIISNQGFGLSVYGFDRYESYGYQGGLRLARMGRNASLDVVVDNASPELGSEVCITASVMNQSAPVIGARVDFVTTGINSGYAHLFTDTNGQARYCYAGSREGVDDINISVRYLNKMLHLDWQPPSGNNASTPLIVSTPVKEAFVGRLYQYQLVVANRDPNNTLHYSLSRSHEGMSIDNQGIVSWVPIETQIGIHDVEVVVRDSLGRAVTQNYQLRVNQLNRSPELISIPESIVAYVGHSGHAQVVAVDPDGDQIFYESTDSPTYISINSSSGQLSWRPTSNMVGDFIAHYRMSERKGGSTEFQIPVSVRINNLPWLAHAPSEQAKVSYAYRSQLQYGDIDGDTLSYYRVSGPKGLSIDAATGQIFWTPSPDQIGVHEVRIQIRDAIDIAYYQFFITVTPSDAPLVATVTTTPSIIDPGGVVTIKVGSTGAVGDAVYTLSVNGLPLALDDSQQATYSGTDTPGLYTLLVTAEDGVQVSQVDGNFYVRDLSDVTPPSTFISTPFDMANITAPTDVVVTASDANLTGWRLLLMEKGAPSTQYEVLAEGTADVIDSTVASFDPSLRLNGQYNLILEATDINGQTSQDNVTLMVDGDLKVGNFTITLEDLNIPVVGIPVRVTRTYDSRRRHEALDFGQGWSIDYQNVRVQESRTPGKFWALNEYASGPLGLVSNFCVEPQGAPLVTVTLPDGSMEKFEAAASPHCNQSTPFLDVNLVFNPVDDTQSSLEALEDSSARLVNGELVETGFYAAPVNPNRYLLTTRSGYRYYLDQGFGIEKVVDPNGHTLTYTADGIFHSSGKAVTFIRDASGRIEQITDPSGNVLNYGYDAANDLIASANPVGESTSYTYNSSHGLLDIIDPSGNRIVRNIYDAHGRLIAQEDNLGNRTDFNHNIAGRQSQVTDRRGNTTLYYYDDEGNVTSVVDALGGITAYTFDLRGNQLSKTDANGNTSNASYSAANDQLTQSDALGHTTRFSYNPRGQELTITDAMGHVYENVYDGFGNLLSITDPMGNIAGNNINAQGLPSLVRDALGNGTTYTYDADGNKLSETDALGNVTAYTYDTNGNTLSETRTVTINGIAQIAVTRYAHDAMNRLLTTTDALGGVTRHVYDLAGNKVEDIDADGNVTTYRYDVYHRLTRTTYPDGTSELRDYDAEGNLVNEVDRNGMLTVHSYDALNRRISTTHADGTVTRSEYDAVGNLTAEVDERGNRTTHAYDAANRRISTTDALGGVTTFGYDANGNLLSRRDANGNTTGYVYDALDRRTETIHPDGSRSKVGYDALGRVISRTDQAGIVTQYGYDALGRLTSVTDAQGNITRYSYDEAGNKTTQTDALGRTTTWDYDLLGRELGRRLPLGQRESRVYAISGRLLSHTDFNGQTTTYSYDLNGRRTGVSYADGSTESFSYDANGNRTAATNRRGESRAWAYDSRGRLTADTKADGSVLSYGYDASGNRTRLTETLIDGVGHTTTYGYDGLNRLLSVRDAANQETTYRYDAVGNRATVSYPNGNTTRYVYDSLNRLTRQQTVDAANTPIADYQYTLAPGGQRTQVSELSGATTRYVYDSLHCLTEEHLSGHPVLGSQSNRYTYDAVGNRTYAIENGVHTAYSYDANDRLTQAGGEVYSYDANGNTLSVSVDTTVTDYQYDAANKMVGMVKRVGGQWVDEVGYAYDIDGIRIAANQGAGQTRFLVDHNRDYAQVLRELDAYGTTGVSYLYGDDLIRQSRAANDSYYLYDGHGSTRSLTDSNGHITDSYDYSAYGEVIHSEGTTENSYLYAGEQFDASLGDYYLRARYYDPGVNRFRSMDSWMGNEGRPVTLNKYLYADANPVNNVDPSGHMSLGLQMSISNIQSTMLTISTRGISLMRAYDVAEAASGFIEFSGAVRSAMGEATSFSASQAVRSGIPDINMQDAIESAIFNMPKAVAAGVYDWGKGYSRSKRRGQKLSSFLIYMPLLSAGAGGGVSVPTPAKVRFGNEKIPIEIVFGGRAKASGSLFGIGVKMGGLRQLVRMDYHQFNPGHGGAAGVKGNEVAVWSDENFHYHVNKWDQ